MLVWATEDVTEVVGPGGADDPGRSLSTRENDDAAVSYAGDATLEDDPMEPFEEDEVAPRESAFVAEEFPPGVYS